MAGETLDRTIHRHPDHRTVTATVSGDWDSLTDGTLVEELRRVLEEGYRNIIIQAADVSFCDSVCVGALAGLYHLTSDRGGWLRVVAPNHAVRRPLQIAGLDEIFDVVPHRTEDEKTPDRTAG